MKKITLPTVFCLLLFVFSCMRFAAQNSIIELSIKDQTQLANQVVEAEVLSSESFWDTKHENIYTKHTLKVYKVFKGSKESTIDLIVSGGVVGLEAEKVSHCINIRPGDVGMFILKNLNNNRNIPASHDRKIFESVSGDQGFYRYDQLNLRVANPYRAFADIHEDIYKEIIKASKITEPIIVSNFKFSEGTDQIGNEMRVEEGAERLVISFTASDYTGGTRAVLTVTGEGFGSIIGNVAFSNSDYGGYLKTNVLPTQILSWNNTEILVEIPSFAGTGYFTVKTSDGAAIDSGQPININYAQTNMEYDLGSGTTAFNTRHIGENGDGGYTFSMNNNFASSGAREAFTRAFETWSCQSGINWEIGTNRTNANTDVEDGINIITFDENNNLPAGKLAQCKSRFKACYADGELKWYVTEIDIMFNDRSDWHTAVSDPSNSSIDLESVALHELGHGHQLNHVIDREKVMHYSLVAGDNKRELSEYDAQGAEDVQSRSTSAPVCGKLSMTNVSCSTLGTDDFSLNNEISFYPNPAKSFVTIKNRSSAIIENVELFSINGNRVKRTEFSGSGQLQLHVSELSQGIYMMKIQTDLGIVMNKLVIN